MADKEIVLEGSFSHGTKKHNIKSLFYFLILFGVAPLSQKIASPLEKEMNVFPNQNILYTLIILLNVSYFEQILQTKQRPRILK